MTSQFDTTGPAYPPPPPPGSNAIGVFEIGVSPIGDIPPFYPPATVISQYANSPILCAIINSFFTAADQTEDYSNLYDFVWNVATAVGYGLDVWGRIVGVVRTVTISTTTFFGFEQQAPTVDDFGPGGASPFYSGTSATDNYDLTDSAFRQLIYAKALSNITNGSIQSINQILRLLFPGRGNCYVRDNMDMTMTYVFQFALSPVEQAIVSGSNVLPQSTGVRVSIEQIF